MKTVTQHISLTEEMARFALAEVEEGGYGSLSDYFADLLRQRRQGQIEADLEFLADAMKDAPPGPEPVEEIVTACKTARREMRKERWKP